MYILLCAATDFEIQPTIDFIADKARDKVGVLVTGVGLTAATYQLTKSILSNKPAIVMQAGIAGCFNEQLPLGKVVAVKSESIGDLGVFETGVFKSLFDMNFIGSDSFPWTNRKLVNESSLLKDSGLEIVDSVTINEISTSADRINYYKKQLDVQVESMEGAALHYVCLHENVSFLQIRSLSNFVGERDKSKWMIKEALTSLNSELQRIILKLLHQ